MKRPVRPGQPVKKPAVPNAAVKNQAAKPVAKKPSKPSRISKPSVAKAQPRPKRLTSSKLAKPNERLKNKQAKLEAKRLSALAKTQKKNQIASTVRTLSSEARRFQTFSRRRRITLGVTFGSIAALVALVAATIFTPMLAVEAIEIRGLDRIPEKTIRKVLEKQIGKPLPLVNSDEIAVDLEKFALIESFSAISQPPHSLQIRIRERQPIVIVNSSGRAYLYDPAGVQIGLAKASDKYPILTITGSAKNSAEFKAAIDVLLALPATLLPKVATIDAKSKDDVSMQLRGYAGQRIIWGDASQSVLKSKTLAALLKNQNRTDRVTYDVSSPTTPVVKY